MEISPLCLRSVCFLLLKRVTKRYPEIYRYELKVRSVSIIKDEENLNKTLQKSNIYSYFNNLWFSFEVVVAYKHNYEIRSELPCSTHNANPGVK